MIETEEEPLLHICKFVLHIKLGDFWPSGRGEETEEDDQGS